MQVRWALTFPIVFLMWNTGDICAQTTFTGGVTETISSVWITQIDGSGSDIAANNKFTASLSIFAARPRLKLASDLRLMTTVEPQMLASGGSGDAGGSSRLGLGSRFLPALTLGVVGQVTPTFYVAAYDRIMAFMTLGAGGTFGSSPGTDVTTTDAGTTTGAIGGDNSNSSVGSGASSSPYAAYLNLLPQNSWANEVGTVLGGRYNSRLNPVAGAQYRMFRQFDCSQQSLDTGVLSQDYRNDSVDVYGRFDAEVRPATQLSTELRARRDDNRPMPECLSDGDSTGTGGVFYQIMPQVQVSRMWPTWRLDVKAGTTILLGRERDASGTLGDVASWDVLPIGTVDVSRKFARGDIRGQSGIEVATLFGQSTPTYNLMAGTYGSYRPTREWAFTGGLSLLRAFSFLGNDSQSGQGANGMILFSGRVGLNWHPVYWFEGRLEYLAAYQKTEWQSFSGPEGAAIGDGLEQNRLLWNMVSLTATFVLGGGFGDGMLPRLSNWL